MRVKALIEVYLEDVAARASLAPTSRERYVRLAVDLVMPGMGDLQVREITVPAINRFLSAIARKHGYGTAKMARSVLSGMVQLAIDHGALRDNPVRQSRRLEAPRAPVTRALTVAEHSELLDKALPTTRHTRWTSWTSSSSSPPPAPASARPAPSARATSTSTPESSRSPPPPSTAASRNGPRPTPAGGSSRFRRTRRATLRRRIADPAINTDAGALPLTARQGPQPVQHHR